MADALVRYRFTVDEWQEMGRVGLFDEDARLELIDGEVVEMTPIGNRHALCVTRLNGPPPMSPPTGGMIDR